MKKSQKIQRLIDEIHKKNKILEKDEMELSFSGVLLKKEKKIEEYKMDDDFVLTQKKKFIEKKNTKHIKEEEKIILVENHKNYIENWNPENHLMNELIILEIKKKKKIKLKIL